MFPLAVDSNLDGASSMSEALQIALLADHPEVIPVLKGWYETEWRGYYGPGGPGNAEEDLRAFARRDGLPVGVVAFQEGAVCGIAALKSASIESHAHLMPWAAAGMVAPDQRGRGIGARMLQALEGVARDLGFDRIYCGTGTSESLLLRGGWKLVERIVHDGEDLSIFEKAL
jgi:GNAT superfamily N-acetyltransferase